MNNNLQQLESIISQNLLTVSNLKNAVIQKDLEKSDQLKALSLGIIDVVDSFQRIEENIAEKGLPNVEDVSKTMNRYKTIQKKLLNLLQKHGVQKINFPENKLIVGLCEVIDTEPDNSRQNDDIVSVVRNGYVKGEEVIRAAQVIVIRN